MVVPWIGGQEEVWKALKIYVTGGHGNVWVFQDYWYPAHENAIKYCVGKFSYKDAKEIPGNNRGGGNKRLLINVEDFEENGKQTYVIKLEIA
ncbi:hypothetical protein [Photorhabdus temperata]|uniref:hypothetical protein n=1 Tax=Photorhabdus temperata TaxID=574560 RepID=UPI00038A401C|nr:hypothetical protein [Photorhabdus temperata]EQB98039.1 hypothetical protein B738_27322 [Photorhabdus temperata subsp. temperata M1021]